MTCKCKNCEQRTLGCHDTCEAYAEYRAYIAGVREQERAAKMTTWATPREENRIRKNVRIKNSQSRR